MENYTNQYKKFIKTLSREKQEQLINDNLYLMELEITILNQRTPRMERKQAQALLKGIKQLDKEIRNTPRQEQHKGKQQLLNESNNPKAIINNYDLDFYKFQYWLKSRGIFRNRERFKALKEKSILSPSYIQKYNQKHKTKQAIYLKKWKQDNKEKVAKHNKDYYLRSKQFYNIDYLIIPNLHLRHKRTLKSILKRERDFRKAKEQETKQEIIREIITRKGERERKITNILKDQ